MNSCPSSGEFDRSAGSNPLQLSLYRVVRLKVDRCIILIVTDMQMYKQIILLYSVVINAYVAIYHRMYYLSVMQDFSVGSL